jgi:hypothetical protein
MTKKVSLESFLCEKINECEIWIGKHEAAGDIPGSPDRIQRSAKILVEQCAIEVYREILRKLRENAFSLEFDEMAIRAGLERILLDFWEQRDVSTEGSRHACSVPDKGPLTPVKTANRILRFIYGQGA